MRHLVEPQKWWNWKRLQHWRRCSLPAESHRAVAPVTLKQKQSLLPRSLSDGSAHPSPPFPSSFGPPFPRCTAVLAPESGGQKFPWWKRDQWERAWSCRSCGAGRAGDYRGADGAAFGGLLWIWIFFLSVRLCCVGKAKNAADKKKQNDTTSGSKDSSSTWEALGPRNIWKAGDVSTLTAFVITKTFETNFTILKKFIFRTKAHILALPPSSPQWFLIYARNKELNKLSDTPHKMG